jgi:hypothetical protein
MKKKQLVKASIMALFTWFHISSGQLTTQVEMSAYHDNNIFLSPEPVSDLVSLVNLNVRYKPESGNISYFYDGIMSLYRQQQSYNSTTHGGGLDYYKTFGTSDQNTLYLGSEVTLKFNQSTFDIYNYQQFYLYANLRYLFNTFIFKTGYNFRYRNYANYNEISNTRHYLFAHINKSFDSGTSVLVETDLGYKQYPNQGSVYSAAMGRGKGRNQTLYPSGLNYTQIILLTRFSQSLHPKIGLNLQYRKQINPVKDQELISTVDYTQNDELFDDPFSYQSNEFSSQLTWMLPFSFKLVTYGIYAAKSYHNQTAYTSSVDEIGEGDDRIDYRQSVSVALYKNFTINNNWLKSVQFMVNYRYINNDSNSYWYRYANGIYYFDVSWRF